MYRIPLRTALKNGLVIFGEKVTMGDTTGNLVVIGGNFVVELLGIYHPIISSKWLPVDNYHVDFGGSLASIVETS